MSKKDLAQELLDLKQKAEKAQQEASEYKGQLKQLYQSLKDEFDCTNTDQAEVLLGNMKKEQQNLEQKIEQEINRIRNDYGFNQTA